ncbi:putative N-glycosidase YbiA [Hypsibius exemplaris]|uniref:N-glycosidase YbiA n=1 Tax=Hypsibius exemplaris TaxID=2072580 RepID=A0A1W0XAP9_HYPEX|nr:putative N-glycosidase YbiA [Hypsibius exemplaris]
MASRSIKKPSSVFTSSPRAANGRTDSSLGSPSSSAGLIEQNRGEEVEVLERAGPDNPSAESAIEFYNHRKEPYGIFSNFYPAEIHLDGRRWDTTEHYFQAKKFLDEKNMEMIRTQPSPGKAASAGRRRDLPLRNDWERVKDDVMKEAVYAKFSQHVELRKRLLQTGQRELVEHTTRDAYWGDGGHGGGKNMLGKILMATRDRLRREENPKN